MPRWLMATVACVGLLLIPLVVALLVGPGEPPPPRPMAAAAETEVTPAPQTAAAVAPTAARPRATHGPTPAVGGQVLDPEGEPVQGALVRCNDQGDEVDEPAKSDATGHFNIPSELAGCVAVARHRSYGDSRPVRLGAGDGNRLQLRELASIEGMVVDEQGLPVTQFTVVVEGYRPARADVGRGHGVGKQVDDAGGRFELRGLQPGRYVLVVSTAGRPPAHSEATEVASAERVAGLRIVLPTGALLYGVVSDADSGEVIAGAQVALDAATLAGADSNVTGTADEEGRYELEGVPAGPFSIRVAADGYVSRVLAAITTGGGAELEHDIALSPAEEGGPQAEYTGIGAMLTAEAQGVVVAGIVTGAAAEAAGLRKGDVIASIEGREARDYTVAQAVQLLRGRAGTRVAVSVLRSGAEVDLVILRETFTQ